MVCLSHIRYDDILLRNDVRVDEVEGGHVLWYVQCSWRKNAGTWFSISTVCSSDHVVWYALCLQCERVVSIKDHEVHDGKKV